MKRKTAETKVVLIIFLFLELALCILMSYRIISGDQLVHIDTDQLIIVGFILGFMYILYVELRAKKFSEYLVDEKVKTHTLLEALPEGALVLDKENCVITGNKKAEEVLKINMLDFINRDFTDLVDDESKSLLLNNQAGRVSARGVTLNVTPLKGQGKLVTVDKLEETFKFRKPTPTDPLKLVDSFLKSASDYRSSLFALRIKNFFEEETIPKELAREEIKLKELIDSCLAEFCNIGGNNAKGVNLDIKIPNDCMIYADKKLLYKALGQLILNAITYTKDKIEISASEDEKDIQIQIKDNGIGIVEEDMPKVFDNGFTGSSQLEETQGGRGIGLYLAKKIIDSHGGALWIESKPGSGALVSFNLPRG